MPSPRLRHEAIFLLVFALDLVNMFIATVAYPCLLYTSPSPRDS